MTRKRFHLHFNLEAAPPVEPAPAGGQPSVAPTQGNEYLATFIVGDATYHGIFFPAEEIAKAVASMDGQPVNLDHSDGIEDEVGFVKQPAMFQNALKGLIVLNPATAKFHVAKAWVLNRLHAGKAPEVSVGVLLDLVEEDVNGVIRLTARNLSFDHLALVSRGACSPKGGCGIGFSDANKCYHGRAREIECAECVAWAAETGAPAGSRLMDLIPFKQTTMTEDSPAASPPPLAAETPPPNPPAEAASPCGCAGLKAEIEKLTQERVALEARLEAYEAREIAELKADVEKLGVPVEATDGIECLRKKLAVATAVAAKLGAQPPAVLRHTKPNTEGSATGDDAQVRNLLARMGIPLSA